MKAFASPQFWRSVLARGLPNVLPSPVSCEGLEILRPKCTAFGGVGERGTVGACVGACACVSAPSFWLSSSLPCFFPCGVFFRKSASLKTESTNGRKDLLSALSANCLRNATGLTYELWRQRSIRSLNPRSLGVFSRCWVMWQHLRSSFRFLIRMYTRYQSVCQ